MSDTKPVPANSDTIKKMNAIKDHILASTKDLHDAGDIIRKAGEKLENPNQEITRQEYASIRESLTDVRTRLDIYNETNYMQLLFALRGRCKNTSDDATIVGKDLKIINQIALFFFAMHEDIAAWEHGDIGEAEKAEAIAYLDKALDLQQKNPRLSLEQAISRAIGVDIGAKPKLTSKVPQKHVMPNNKLTNTLTTNTLVDSIIDVGVYDLEVIGKGKKAITTACILTYEGDNVKLTGRQPFTEYDRNVYNAVTSLYEYGDKSHIVTPATVYRAMVNMTLAEKPSDQQLEAVTRSLDKMRFIRARVDCTNELTKRGASIDGEQITGGKIDTYLLAAEAVEVEAGGKTVRAYHIIKTPILYEYSKLLKQVLTVPAGLLDIHAEGQRVKNTEQRIAIKGYLLRRIEVMNGKTRNRQSRHILFDAIYEASGADNPDDKEKERIRTYAFIVLDYWKAQGYITDYERLRTGTTYTGIAIA